MACVLLFVFLLKPPLINCRRGERKREGGQEWRSFFFIGFFLLLLVLFCFFFGMMELFFVAASLFFSLFFGTFAFFSLSSSKVRPLIWIQLQTEKHSRSRIEYLVKVFYFLGSSLRVLAPLLLLFSPPFLPQPFCYQVPAVDPLFLLLIPFFSPVFLKNNNKKK